MQALLNRLGTIAKFEKDSISLDNARLAIMPEQEHRDIKQPELTESGSVPTTEKHKRKKKVIDLSTVPGEPIKDETTDQ